jgi:glycosyltransferase involved in cell wall biosynthesis
MILDRSIELVDHVITVSTTMKEEILKYYPHAQISVVYNGVDANGIDGISHSAKLAVRKNLNLPEEFILAVGHFEERKNYLRLIDSISILRDKGFSCSLVIIGNDSGGRDVLEKRIENLNLSRQVQLFSGLSNLEVGCAYKLCSLFVFPSTYEGFGIPILEAMAAGCPMALSDILVFQEITQSTGIYFPCDDVGLMASSIERGLSSCVDRVKSVEYGRDRIKVFNFKLLATELADLYKNML